MTGVFDDARVFAANIASNRPLMALDLGDKTIGVAVSDRIWCAASPRESIRRKKGSFTRIVERLADIVVESGCVGVVVGLPKNMDGSEGPRCQSARAIADNICACLGVPVLLWDERLSTIAAERVLLEADLSRKRRKEVVDSVAAAYILQGVLARMRNLKELPDDQRPIIGNLEEK